MDALKQSPFGRLPEGVLAHVFSFLPDPQHLFQCQATCRSWKSSVALARPRMLEMEICEGYHAPTHWLAEHSDLIQDVRDITFFFSHGLPLELLEVWDIVLCAALRLEVLNVEVWNLEATLGEEELAVLPHSLTSLCLRGVTITAEAWASVPSGIHLRTFELSDCSPEASASLPSPLPACMASLTCLCLRAPNHPSFAAIVVGCPMLQQLKLMFDWSQRVASWEPLTRLAFLRNLTIESGFDLLRAGYLEHGDLKALPALDLDAFPALQKFSGQHCAGVKGHVHGAYIDTGYVQSISLKSIRAV